jgi:O-antigen ligase
VFALTLSKGAWLAFAISLVIAAIFNFRYIKIHSIRAFIFKNISLIILSIPAIVIFAALLTIQFPIINVIVTNTFEHVIETVQGQSPTIVERDNFTQDALTLLPANVISGIGNGQYGEAVKALGRITKNGGFLIVNNVYLEIWLENGLLPLLIFLILISTPVILSLYKVKNLKNKNHKFVLQVLSFSLLAYYIQWFTFSPIFIMPIWILIGLLINATSREQEY